MSIRLFHETRLRLSQAAQRQNVSVSTVYRWHYRGVRGVRLETYVVGAVRYTSAEALERFAAACTTAADGVPVPARTSAQRDRAIAAAEKSLGI